MFRNNTFENYQNRLIELDFAYQQIEAAKLANSKGLVERYVSELTVLISHYNELPPTQPEIFTIPKIFNKTHNENFISDYIAYILDPRKNGIGIQPLTKLLGLVAPEHDLSGFQKVEIIREYPLNERRIDLLILVDDSLVIGLENKIFAFESGEQTINYAQVIDQLFPDRERFYIFLTIGGDAAYSDKFHAISYHQLLTALQTVQFPAENFKKRALWEDFLTHVEEHLTMNSNKLDIPEPEKLTLYLKHHKMIKDLSFAYENSRDAVFNLIAQNIQERFGNLDWKYDFNATRQWQLMYKPHWFMTKPPILVEGVLWFSREILLSNEFMISIEVQGNQKWDTQEEIPQFFNLFKPRFEAQKHIYKEKGMRYLNSLPERPQLAKLGLAWKKYPLIIDPEQVETVSVSIIQAIEEFEFLLNPIEETIQEIQMMI